MSLPPSDRDLAWSLPNCLTYGRIAAVPVVVACLLGQQTWLNWLALAIYAAAAVSDFFDGYLARIWQQSSSLGRMLDPIADKLLVAACLLTMSAEGIIDGIHIWAAVVILSREILVSGLREFLAELRVSVPVTRLAKWKTAAQMVAVGVLIIAPALDMQVAGVTEAGLVLLWVSALLTLYTGYDYFRAGLKHVF
jgi:cardiolipin synthase (CMP-forming)